MSATLTFKHTPEGPFDLANQNQYFGGWPTLPEKPACPVLAFPVEGWIGSAAVVFSQAADAQVTGQVYAPVAAAEKARQQALAVLSLDAAAAAWPAVSGQDPVIGELQNKYLFLRPNLFHSPYEAAAGFVIGHRISMKQKQTLIERISQEFGERIEIEGQAFHAFPGPQTLLQLATYKGLSELKIERLHGVAQAALEGVLDRDHLRALPLDDALGRLKSIPGIGPFFAQGILHRGAGIVDDVPEDDLTQYAVQHAYKLSEPPDRKQILEIARAWQPFRMWATVLLHIWVRREVGLPSRRTFSPR